MMSKGLMYLWGAVIFLMCGTILVIGLQHKDTTFIDLENNLRKVSLKYIKDKKISLSYKQPIILYVDKLIEEDYIKDTKEVEKFCVESIIINKGIIVHDFDLNMQCEKNEEKEE